MKACMSTTSLIHFNVVFFLCSPQHHSPSSSSSSDSYDSDYDRAERPKNRKSQGSDGQSSQVSSPPLACWCLIFLKALLSDIFLFDCWLASMDGIQREAMATHRSPRRTRAVILTNTATTVMTSMTMMKRRMSTKVTCPSIRSQKIQFPRVREEDAMLMTRWREEAWGGWNNSSVWMLFEFKHLSYQIIPVETYLFYVWSLLPKCHF